jgi:hypothetical protein
MIDALPMLGGPSQQQDYQAGELTTAWIWPPRASQLAARPVSTSESASSQAAKQP